MPIIKSAIKKVRKDKKRTASNRLIKKDFRTKIKQLEKEIASGDVLKAASSLSVVFASLDKAAKKGILEKNTVARKKSRLAKQLNKKVGKAVDLKSVKIKTAEKPKTSAAKPKAKPAKSKPKPVKKS